MKIKAQNSSYAWPSRVREYAVIPDRTISKEESWKKIRERLDQAPKRKNPTWYWLAAASVVLFVAIIWRIPVSNRTVESRFTKTPAVLKQNNNPPVRGDTIQAATNTAVKPTNPGIKTALRALIDSPQLAHAKKESVVPLPKDSVLMVAGDTAAVADDMVQYPTPLPSVHINDLINAEPMPEHITTKSLAVKKMIRLFSIDLTKEQQPKKQGAIPTNQYSIPNNQN